MTWDVPEATDLHADADTPADADTLADPQRDDPPGLYGPTSEAWRLNREATILLGAGPRALLLQHGASARRGGRRPAFGVP